MIRLLTALACGTGFSLSGGQAKPPVPRHAGIEYNAATDRVVRPKPPVPALGNAGSIVKDPTYGSRIVRITDRQTSEGYACSTSAAALANTWSADSTKFVAICSGGTWAFALEPGALKTKALGALELLAVPAFSYSDPDLLYGITSKGERKLMEYDFRRKKYRTLLALEDVVPKFRGGASGQVSASANERIAVAFGGEQDTFPYVVVFDKRTGRRTLLNTREATVDGKPAGFGMGYGIHLVNIDKSGRYVIVSKGNGQKGPNLLVWDTEANRFGEVAERGGGHYAAGYGVLVNCDGWWPQWAQWLLRPLEPPKLAGFRKLIIPNAPDDFGQREEHSSWANARPDAWAPVFDSITRRAGAKYPLGPWDDEIVAISTDPASPKVFRFAHHRCLYDGNFWDTPRGNVSPDGRFFAFTSNWEKTLGTSPERQSRQDVFVLELPPIVQ